MNVKKKLLTALLTSLMLVSFLSVNIFAANIAGTTTEDLFSDSNGGNDLNYWLHYDPVDGVTAGDAAYQKMGELGELLLEAGAEELSPKNQFSPYQADFYATIPDYDMSKYDVLNLAGKSYTADSDGCVTISDAFDAAEYILYMVMSGNGWLGTHTDVWNREMTGVYMAVMSFDVDIPWTNVGFIDSLFGEINSHMIGVYFPFYYNSSCKISGRKCETTGVQYVDKFYFIISESIKQGNNTTAMQWKAVCDEVEDLVGETPKNVSTVFKTISEGDTRTTIAGGANDFEKLRNIHDYVAAITVYDLKAPMNQTPYSALISKKSVCNGYALATSLLAFRMGINAPYIMGSAGGPHAWNIYIPSGEWIGATHLDATWARIQNPPNANGGNSVFQGLRNEYFNASHAKMAESHTWIDYYPQYIDYINGVPNVVIPDKLVFSKILDSINSLTVIAENNSDATISLNAETISLPVNFTVTKYSLNGGAAWKTGTLPTGANFSKLFDKDLILWIESSDGTQIKFPKIKMRPKANPEKLAAFYEETTWSMMTKPTKNAAERTPGLEYEYLVSTDGKFPTNPSWQSATDKSFDIIEKPAKGDRTKNVYYFRTVATASGGFTPAGKPFKISPAYLGGEPKYKADYKNEIIKLKKEDLYSTDGGKNWNSPELDARNKPIPLDISDFIASETSLQIKKAATGKKPATLVQTIAIAGRAELEGKKLAVTNGKIDSNQLKSYEIWNIDVTNPAKSKWKGLPKKPEGSGNSLIYDVRLKATAKLSKTGLTGKAASDIGTITITYDDDGKIIGATITLKDNKTEL